MIRVLIVDDSAIVRRGIARLLTEQPDMQIAGEAENGQEGLELLAGGLSPEMIQADFDMPVMDGWNSPGR